MEKDNDLYSNIFAFNMNHFIISRAAHWVPTTRVICQVCRFIIGTLVDLCGVYFVNRAIVEHHPHHTS